ncbi:hypothetical protein [Jiangella asiatica]|uniref:Uncharacterized protein n=1 Tax=Jiangella asiatica TaxID=2530372 RepID=A0A4R5CE26_9ACTN|nr:hypothetical protein [Jiangella asiatica]TDD95412.1 hypothetical protein E1269_31180 [Jiangella asiatica]
MSYWSAHLMHAMFDGLRYFMWMTISGLAVVGAAFYGGAGVHAFWQKSGPPARRRRDAVAREAEAGIAEIEAYLAARSPGSEPSPEPEAPPVERGKRPPGSGETA